MAAKLLPYRIGVLCYLYDAMGRVLLLRRARHPNQHLHSPVGGKLDQERGESPTSCALREIREETGVALSERDLHLAGIISETAFCSDAHWLMFLFEVTRAVRVDTQTIDEGSLEWHVVDAIPDLEIPETDRHVIWPLVHRFRGRFFAAHIDCGDGGLTWRLEQPATEADGDMVVR